MLWNSNRRKINGILRKPILRTGIVLLSVLPLSASGAVKPDHLQQVPPATRSDAAGNEELNRLIKETPILPLKRVVVQLHRPLGIVSAATGDTEGNIYILQRSETGDPVVVINRSGEVVQSWGEGSIKVPHSIHIDDKGYVWITDAGASVVSKYTRSGKKLLTIPVPDIPHDARPYCGITGVGFEPNGKLLISDGYCNARILEYSAEGKRINSWGRAGEGRGEFRLPHDVAVGIDGTVYVADRENGRLQWFRPDGEYKGERWFGGRVHSLAIDRDGATYVGVGPRSPTKPNDNANIFKFDPVGNRLIGRLPILSHETEVGNDGSVFPGSAQYEQGPDKQAAQFVFFEPFK